MFRTAFILASVMATVLLTATIAAAQGSTGTIEGRVFDPSGDPLPGATVALEGTSIVTSTDLTGSYRVAGAPEGERSLLVSYLGSQDARLAVSVRAGSVVVAPEAALQKIGYAETVTVTGDEIKDAQAR